MMMEECKYTIGWNLSCKSNQNSPQRGETIFIHLIIVKTLKLLANLIQISQTLKDGEEVWLGKMGRKTEDRINLLN